MRVARGASASCLCENLAVCHQIRAISLLQNESGETPQSFDRNFCKENDLYYRIAGNITTSGVYATEGSSSENEEEGETFELDDYEIDFYVKKYAVKNADGKYDDFIGVANREFLIQPETIGEPSVFYAVYASDLPDPDDDNYDDRVDEENDKIYKEFVEPYIENGKKISINRVGFISANLDRCDMSKDPTGILKELRDIIQLAEDDSEDASNGVLLYTL